MKISSILFYGPLFILSCCGGAAAQRKWVTGKQPITFQEGRSNEVGVGNPILSSSSWVVKGIDRLTSTLMHDIYSYEGSSFNIVMSPIGIWSVLVMLLEASAGETRKELRRIVEIKDMVSDTELQMLVQSVYPRLRRLLQIDNNSTEFSMHNFLVSDKKNPVTPEYKYAIEQIYAGQTFTADFQDKAGTAKMLNDWVKKATHERITGVITPGEVHDLMFVIGNAAYFKAMWKFPFNYTLTKKDQFKDESDEIKNEIDMMTQRLVIPYGYSTKLEAQIVEIPYGDDLTSMIVILPRRRVKFGDVLSKMKNLTLEELSKGLTEDEVELHLPRFTIQCNMYLNKVLVQYLPRVFSPLNAEFPKLSKDVHVSKVSHKAEIENSEEGTIASAVTSAQVSYKTTTVRFHANRPFLYFINERKTRTILFAGTLTNPNTVGL